MNKERIIKNIDRVINTAVNVRIREIVEGRVYQLKEDHSQPNDMRRKRGEQNEHST